MTYLDGYGAIVESFGKNVILDWDTIKLAELFVSVFKLFVKFVYYLGLKDRN